MAKKSSKNAAFSLVEVSVVLVIGGLILTMLSNMLGVYFANEKLQSTKTKIEAIENQINKHLTFNGYLPCPASRSAAVDTANFGMEVTPDCITAPSSPTTTSLYNGNKVRVGVVPVRKLNLPDEYMFDAWGNRITYAVSTGMAVNGHYDDTSGAIAIIDSNGNSVIDPAGTANYVVISHGPDGNGAFSAAGVKGADCPTAAMGTLDGENCSPDHIFRSTILTSTTGGAGHYDDLINFNNNNSQPVPPKALMAFRMTSCPPGWANYTGTVPSHIDAGSEVYCEKK